MEYSTQGTTAAGRYEALVSSRSVYDREAKESSKLTIPSLIPEQTTGTRARIKTPFQATGSRGVNSLSNKLLMTLLPPSTAFFKLEIDNLEIRKQGQEQMQSEIDKGLRTIENALMNQIEISNDRVAMFEAIKHLVVSGNVLLYLTDAGLKVYPLSKFVCKRDAMGNVLEWSYPNWPSHIDHILISNELFSLLNNEESYCRTIKIDDFLDGGFNEYDQNVSDHRPVAIKLAMENNIFGDINNDELVNILDVILIVNLVLTENYDQIADINSDNEINILDVVAIVNLILN